MIVITHRVEYEHTGDIIVLKPCFDWHIGHRYCDIRAIRQWLDKDASNEKAFLLGGGDLLDSIVVTDPRYRKSIDAAPDDAVINYQLDSIEKLLRPYKGRIIGLGHGNHEDTILKRSSLHLSRELAKRLDTVSLGTQWAVILTFYRNWKGKQADIKSIKIFGHHGWGGGTSTEGYTLTKYAKHAERYDADLFLYGHDHRADSSHIDRIIFKGNKMITQPKHLVFCGTFKKTFSETDEPTWEETRGFKPVPIGGVNIELKVERKGLDIKVDV